MNQTKKNVTVIGTTEAGVDFTENVEFILVPPAEDEPHYGTGYYMVVKTPYNRHLIDVRYEGIVDIEVLSNRWIKSYYGKNAKEVINQLQ